MRFLFGCSMFDFMVALKLFLLIELSQPGEFYARVLERRIHLLAGQCGFLSGRELLDQLLILSRILEDA